MIGWCGDQLITVQCLRPNLGQKTRENTEYLANTENISRHKLRNSHVHVLPIITAMRQWCQDSYCMQTIAYIITGTGCQNQIILYCTAVLFCTVL